MRRVAGGWHLPGVPEIPAGYPPRVRFLTAVFRAVGSATVVWVLLLLSVNAQTLGTLGLTASFYVTVALVTALMALSGPLLLFHHRYHPERYRERGEWTGAELFYAVVFVLTLFVFLNTVGFAVFFG